MPFGLRRFCRHRFRANFARLLDCHVYRSKKARLVCTLDYQHVRQFGKPHTLCPKPNRRKKQSGADKELPQFSYLIHHRHLARSSHPRYRFWHYLTKANGILSSGVAGLWWRLNSIPLLFKAIILATYPFKPFSKIPCNLLPTRRYNLATHFGIVVWTFNPFKYASKQATVQIIGVRRNKSQSIKIYLIRNMPQLAVIPAGIAGI